MGETRKRYPRVHAVPRCISLDKATSQMLDELSAGAGISRYLRTLLTLEYGKLIERQTRRVTESERAGTDDAPTAA